MYKIVNDLFEVRKIIKHRWEGQSYGLEEGLEDHLRNRDSVDIDELNKYPNFHRVTKIPFYWVSDSGIELNISVIKVHQRLNPETDDDEAEFEISYAVEIPE